MKTQASSDTLNGLAGQEKLVTSKTQARVAQDLHDFFIDCLRDIYWAEKAQTKVMAKMIRKANTHELTQALTGHLEVTQQHISRMEIVFSSIGEKAVSRKCEAMEGLIKEAHSIMDKTKAGVVRDAGIIAAVQKMEHYEIATYGTLCSFAKTLHETDAAALLRETLEEEKAADKKLSAIAIFPVNSEAVVLESEDAGNDSLVVAVKSR